MEGAMRNSPQREHHRRASADQDWEAGSGIATTSAATQFGSTAEPSNMSDQVGPAGASSSPSSSSKSTPPIFSLASNESARWPFGNRSAPSRSSSAGAPAAHPAEKCLLRRGAGSRNRITQ